MIELVSDDGPTGGFRLLFWDGQNAHIDSTLFLKHGPKSDFQPRRSSPRRTSTARSRERFTCPLLLSRTNRFPLCWAKFAL